MQSVSVVTSQMQEIGTFLKKKKKKRHKLHEVSSSDLAQDLEIFSILLFSKTVCLILFMIAKIIFIKS